MDVPRGAGGSGRRKLNAASLLALLILAERHVVPAKKLVGDSKLFEETRTKHLYET